MRDRNVNKISQRQIPLSSSQSEPEGFLTVMSNGRATSPDDLAAEILKLRLSRGASEILYNFHSIVSAVSTSDEVPQEIPKALLSTCWAKTKRWCGVRQL